MKFIEKHLCWSLFLIKLQVWQLFWRTSANERFCTALAPLTLICFTLYSASTFFLIITATTDNISDVCFWFKFKMLQKIGKSDISFSLKSLPSLLFSFSTFFFIKKILLSWELTKMFLPPLTSLKYVHVNK